MSAAVRLCRCFTHCRAGVQRVQVHVLQSTVVTHSLYNELTIRLSWRMDCRVDSRL